MVDLTKLIYAAGTEILIFLDIVCVSSKYVHNLNLTSFTLVSFSQVFDTILTVNLFESAHLLWFTASCIFLVAPYFTAWSTMFKSDWLAVRPEWSKKRKCLSMLYMICPIGITMLFLLDIFHLLEVLILKPINFFATGRSALRAESVEEKGYFKFRGVNELFAETVCQAALQLWILLRLSDSYYDEDELQSRINKTGVIKAFSSSLFKILYLSFILGLESEKNGMW